MKCQPSEELESASDHIPIVTKLHIDIPKFVATPLPQRKNVDWDLFNQRLSKRLRDLRMSASHLATQVDIDLRVTNITRTIQDTASKMVPLARPFQYPKSYWTTECSRLVQTARRARRARRKWTQQNTKENWVAYSQAVNRKKAQIKKDKLIGWRAIVTEVAGDSSKM